MYYSVSEISKKFDMSPHTLRYYSKEDLFPFVEGNKNGNRMFKENDFESIYMINWLKKSEMSIKDIREFMNWCHEGDSTIDNRLNMFKKHKKKVIHELLIHSLYYL